jgi:hypothetical protein
MKELLLLLAHYRFDPSKREILAGLLREIEDWEGFAKLVNAHGIIALSAYNIKEAGLGNLVPAKAMATLENGLMKSVVRNAWLAERWKEVNEILNNAGIKHILLKGMALEHTIYGARGLRQMTDNDILIKREEAIRAWEILQENGYKMMMSKSPLHKKIMMKIHKHLPMLMKDGYAVEIHSELPGERFSDEKEYDRIFDEAPEISVNGIRAFTLPGEVQIAYLVKHHLGHQLSGDCQIRTYSDIKLLDRDNAIEFPDIFINEPDQSYRLNYRRAGYKRIVSAMNPMQRLLFLAGDIFPSVEWMKNRYRCGLFAALIRYPQRLGKLMWLI